MTGRLERFRRGVGREAMISPYGTEDDDSIEHFIWLLDVPEEDLCRVQDEAIALSFSLYDPDPVPFVIGVADPEKSLILRTEGGELW